MPPVVELRALRRTFATEAGEVHALDGVDLAVQPGEMVAVMGTSGSGKSTLLNILGCLDRPTSGEYLLDGQPVARLDDDALADVRNRRLGFVFQGFNLLPRTSALDNVVLPMLYDREHRFPDPEARARAALVRVGLEKRIDHLPNQLSGGQQQRVAVARALVTSPSLLLADEPTGNLDPNTSIGIMRLLDRINRTGTTVVMATHDQSIVDSMRRRVVELEPGGILVRDQARGVYGYGA